MAEPRLNDHALRIAFDASAEACTKIRPVDAALLEAGRKIADRVDDATATAEGQELTKALYLLPHLLNVLREMLATPASREGPKAKMAEAQPTENKLGKLRAVQRGGSSA